VVRDLAPNTQVLARVEEAASVRKMHRAGADYVLSLATVTGRMSASTVIEGRDVLSLNQQIEVVRSRVPRLTGRTIGRANVREATGCTVIAIERDDETVTEIGPDTRIEPDDDARRRRTDTDEDSGVRRPIHLTDRVAARRGVRAALSPVSAASTPARVERFKYSLAVRTCMKDQGRSTRKRTGGRLKHASNKKPPPRPRAGRDDRR